MILATQHAALATLLAVITASAVPHNQSQPMLLSAGIDQASLRPADQIPEKRAALLPRIATLDVREPPFNAKCDWDGDRGTDDTSAFTATAAAASIIYRQHGKPVDVRIGPACKLSSTVVFGSGVHWVGPGTIYVPLQKQGVLRAQNADDVSVSGLTIDVLNQGCGSNKAECSAISWESTPNDAHTHSNLLIHHNVIHHANWGILVGYAAGSGSLSRVEITDNLVTSPHAYMDADGIHVGGRVRDFVISGNTISNRGDAGIAASSEVANFICSNGRIEDNVLLEDQVGLDNSGCTHTLWKANFVRAATSPLGSNPAFRSITYLGLRSSFVTAVGNYLQNASGREEYAMKVDESVERGVPGAILKGNTIRSPLSLYLRGSEIYVEGNVFANDPSMVTIDYDGPRQIATDSVVIEPNRWLGAGTVRSGANPDLITHLQVRPQYAAAQQPSYTGVAQLAYDDSLNGIKRIGLSSQHRPINATAPAYAARLLKTGDCTSVTLGVPGAQTSMSVSVSNSDPSSISSNFIYWAFIPAENMVTVKTCAVASGLLPARPGTLTIG